MTSETSHPIEVATGPQATATTTTETTPATMQSTRDGAVPTPPPAAQQQTLPTQQPNGSKPAPAAQPYVLYAGSYGQPFVPYDESHGPQGFQLQPQHFTALPRPALPERKPWRITKDVLHVVAIVMSIVGLGLGFSLLSRGLGYNGVVGAVASLPIFGICLIWSVAEEITRWARKWGPGIHPGAHVGMSLFLWLSCAVIGGILATFIGLGLDCRSYDYDDNDDDNDDDSSYYGNYGCNNFTGLSGRFLGAVILLLLLWLVHFVLFIGACVDTAKRNSAKHNPIMVVAQPSYWGPMAPHGGQQPATQFPGAAPVQPAQATTSPAVPAAVQRSSNGKEAEMAERSASADHSVREFYSSPA